MSDRRKQRQALLKVIYEESDRPVPCLPDEVNKQILHDILDVAPRREIDWFIVIMFVGLAFVVAFALFVVFTGG